MSQSLTTIVVPFPVARAAAVDGVLARTGNIDGAQYPAIKQALDAAAFIHFMSIVVFRPREDSLRQDTAHLVIELNSDGSEWEAITGLVGVMSVELLEVLFEALDAPPSSAGLRDFLLQSRVEPQLTLFGEPEGLCFQGTPDLSVRRILREEQFVKKVREHLGAAPVGPAVKRLEYVRERIFTDPAFKDHLVSAPIYKVVGAESANRQSGRPPSWWAIGWLGVRDLLWRWVVLPPAALLFVLVVLKADPNYVQQWWSGLWPSVDLPPPPQLPSFLHFAWQPTVALAAWPLWMTTFSQLCITFVELVAYLKDPLITSAALFAAMAAFSGALGVLGYRAALRAEKADVPLDLEPGLDEMRQILHYEDRDPCVQNHFAAHSTLKPGWFRSPALRLALCVIREGSRLSRPGFLDKIGSIHFARWIVLKGTDKLVFLSNYDGSWQSYLEDFIARLREGLSSIWMNTRDFPRTEGLINGGAGDAARFKRWARRQQVPTRFWYSAYPHLSTARIRTNAAICHGFASAATEEEVENWLARLDFPSRETLQFAEIPTLAFGGLAALRNAYGLAIRFPRESKGKEGERARVWLNGIREEITYGERMPPESAAVVAFTARGLANLGLGEDALRTFPVAFQQGMHGRSRALGDQAAKAEWTDEQVDAVLFLYDQQSGRLLTELARHRTMLSTQGCDVVAELPMEQLPANKKMTEPFGFRDGISQPVIRGTDRASRRGEAANIVAAGELVLGYKDNFDRVSPTPRAGGWDIGRNGSFLVIRELDQDVTAFRRFLRDTAKELVDDPEKSKLLPSKDRAIVAEWIAAKMVGRWKDGKSLVRYPTAEIAARHPKSRPDNGFLFGHEDPDGLRCPLGAHIRRANPRDSFDAGSPAQLAISNRHRILRVGRAYRAGQKKAGRSDGIVFMCVNADIERQFEFLQQSWILGPDFHGLAEPDPIVGAKCPMTIPTPNGPLRLKASMKAFVTMKGGGYFFMPGRYALERLATAPRKSRQGYVQGEDGEAADSRGPERRAATEARMN